tara:strand:+ start:146 stop:889 length:744 start_codon:yes stop_codon:yes gene_type:complete
LSLEILSLFLAGIIIGTFNTFSGGGSMVSVPLLIYLGLPPHAANATNRVGVFFQCLSASTHFHKNRTLDLGFCRKIILPSLIGSVLGSLISIYISEAHLKQMMGFSILMVLPLIFLSPEKWLNKKSQPSSELSFVSLFLYFLIGIYGGFLQMGSGILLVSTLVLRANRTLTESHSIKVFILGAFTFPAILIYNYWGLIFWEKAITLSLGSIIGGQIGGSLTLAWSPQTNRRILILTLAMSAWYLIKN